MRSFSLLSGVMICVGLALAQGPQSRPLSAFEKELVTNQKQFIEAWQERNVAYVSHVVSDDFKGIAQNGEIYEKEELVGSVHQGLPKNFRVYDTEVVRIDDTCAVVTYNEIVPGSRPRYRHMSDAWTKDGSQWKLKFRQLTPNLWSALDLD